MNSGSARLLGGALGLVVLLSTIGFGVQVALRPNRIEAIQPVHTRQGASNRPPPISPEVEELVVELRPSKRAAPRPAARARPAAAAKPAKQLAAQPAVPESAKVGAGRRSSKFADEPADPD